MQGSLNYNQIIRGSVIFLNTFGLVLEIPEVIDENAILSVLNKNNEEVGKVFFDDKKVLIETMSAFGFITANYDLPNVTAFVDIETRAGDEKFAEWSTNIKYIINTNEKDSVQGHYLIGTSVDSFYGINASCHQSIEFYKNNKKFMTMKMMYDGRLFEVIYYNKEFKEEIEFIPFDDMSGFLKHDIKKGKYNDEKYCYPYRKYCGVHKNGRDENSLRVLSFEEFDGEFKSYNDEHFEYQGDKDSEDLFIQKGNLFLENDPEVADKLAKLRTSLNIDDISLLDNLMSVSLKSFTDKELESLFGFDRTKLIFQNGADNLIDAYFGINNNLFNLDNGQKRIRKSDKNE